MASVAGDRRHNPGGNGLGGFATGSNGPGGTATGGNWPDGIATGGTAAGGGPFGANPSPGSPIANSSTSAPTGAGPTRPEDYVVGQPGSRAIGRRGSRRPAPSWPRRCVPANGARRSPTNHHPATRMTRTKRRTSRAWPRTGVGIGACATRGENRPPSPGPSASTAMRTGWCWFPTRASAPARKSRLGPSTAGSIDKLVAALWEQMDSWGIAGEGMYWRPVLNVYVAPGAQQRFEDLKILLDGSGFNIERKP